MAFTPYIPQDKAPDELQDQVVQITRLDAALHAKIPGALRLPMMKLLRVVNSYYSNKIEGNSTTPPTFCVLRMLLRRSRASRTCRISNATSKPSVGSTTTRSTRLMYARKVLSRVCTASFTVVCPRRCWLLS